MGFIFVDSFDHYTSLVQKGWWNYGCTISAGNGRFGTAGLYISDDEDYMYRALGAQLTTIYCGFAIKWTTLSVGCCIHQVHSGISHQCGINVHSDGYIYGYRGGYDVGMTQICGPSTVPISPLLDAWHYVEVKYVIHDTAGEIEVHVDGVEVLHATGLDTCYDATYKFVSRYYPNRAGGHPYIFYLDDLYIADDGFKGDVKVAYRNPVGAGSYGSWSPNTGVNNYACVDENPPNTGDYVEELDMNGKDSYAMSDLDDIVGTVLAVAGNYFTQKTDAGSRTLGMLTKLGGNELVSVAKAVPSSFTFLQFIQEISPNSAAWTISNVNAAEMGMKLVL